MYYWLKRWTIAARLLVRFYEFVVVYQSLGFGSRISKDGSKIRRRARIGLELELMLLSLSFAVQAVLWPTSWRFWSLSHIGVQP
jgi:hypothetical protein